MNNFEQFLLKNGFRYTNHGTHCIYEKEENGILYSVEVTTEKITQHKTGWEKPKTEKIPHHIDQWLKNFLKK